MCDELKIWKDVCYKMYGESTVMMVEKEVIRECG